MIKLFEDFEDFEYKKTKIKKGDYVYLDIPMIKFKDRFDNIDNPNYKPDINFWSDRTPFAKVYMFMNRIYSPIRIKLDNGMIYDIDISGIKRYLTQDEIDEYDMLINTKKYNL